jgi:hypothetical protein
MSLKGKREYEITVETPRETHSVTVWPNQHIQSVLGEVLARESITQNLDEYELVQNQQRLPKEQLVRSAGVGDGDTLFIEVNPSGGI